MHTMSDEERRLIGAIGAHTSLSRGNGNADPVEARQALWQKYLDQVDPSGVLPEEERERRAVHARRADMARLALKSVQARRNKARAARDAELFGEVG